MEVRVSKSSLRSMVILGVLATAGSSAASITFSDGEFTAGTWSWEITQPMGGNVVSLNYAPTRISSGGAGDDGAYLDTVSEVWTNPNGGFNAFNWLDSAVYDPSKGSIASIDFSFDVKFGLSGANTYGELMRFALKQGNDYWIDYESPDLTGGPNVGWQHVGLSGYKASDLYWYWNDTSRLPDFSTSGKPITFGFVTGTGAWGYMMGHVAIDNWSVTLNTRNDGATPEPFTLSLGVAALGLCIRRRVRRAL